MTLAELDTLLHELAATHRWTITRDENARPVVGVETRDYWLKRRGQVRKIRLGASKVGGTGFDLIVQARALPWVYDQLREWMR